MVVELETRLEYIRTLGLYEATVEKLYATVINSSHVLHLNETDSRYLGHMLTWCV